MPRRHRSRETDNDPQSNPTATYLPAEASAAGGRLASHTGWLKRYIDHIYSNGGFDGKVLKKRRSESVYWMRGTPHDVGSLVVFASAYDKAVVATGGQHMPDRYLHEDGVNVSLERWTDLGEFELNLALDPTGMPMAGRYYFHADGQVGLQALISFDSASHAAAMGVAGQSADIIHEFGVAVTAGPLPRLGHVPNHALTAQAPVNIGPLPV